MATAQENLTAFENAMAVIGYTLGDIEGTPELDSLKFMELRSLAAQEVNKMTSFNTLKEAAFAALRVQHDEETQALGVLWNEAEANDYTAI